MKNVRSFIKQTHKPVKLGPGGVRTTIAKHHGRYSKSDHLCQDDVE